MIQALYLWVLIYDRETDEQFEKIVSMDTAKREDAVETAMKWMFNHVSSNRDRSISKACLYAFAENILHLHERGLKEKLSELDKKNKKDRIKSLERQLEWERAHE